MSVAVISLPNPSSICFFLLKVQGGVIGRIRGKRGALTLPGHDGRYVWCRDGRESLSCEERRDEEEKNRDEEAKVSATGRVKGKMAEWVVYLGGCG